jgi:hypothetical protein
MVITRWSAAVSRVPVGFSYPQNHVQFARMLVVPVCLHSLSLPGKSPRDAARRITAHCLLFPLAPSPATLPPFKRQFLSLLRSLKSGIWLFARIYRAVWDGVAKPRGCDGAASFRLASTNKSVAKSIYQRGEAILTHYGQLLEQDSLKELRPFVTVCFRCSSICTVESPNSCFISDVECEGTSQAIDTMCKLIFRAHLCLAWSSPPISR